MSNKSNLRTLLVLLFAVFAIAALVFADLGVLAQNSNGSTTGDDSTQNANMSMSTGHHGRRGRRGRRVRHTAAKAGSGIDPNGQATATGDMSGDQTDLSGTYTGHVTMSGGHDMDGDGTLTITGNQFTLESGAMNHSGRVHAVTTRGYTGASFWFPDLTDSTTNTPVVATVRARKSGDRLTLTPVPGTRTKLTFGSGGGRGMSHGRRGRRGRRGAAPAATDTTPPPADTTTSGTAAPTAGEAMGTGEGTGTGTSTPRRGRRRGRPGRRTMTPSANTGDNSNTTPPM